MEEKDPILSPNPTTPSDNNSQPNSTERTKPKVVILPPKRNSTTPPSSRPPQPRPQQNNRQQNYKKDNATSSEFRVNEEIRGMSEVRLVGENIEPGVYPLQKALDMAVDMGLDLVEIVPTAKPPVCRVVEYKKFLYEKKRKEKEIKAKTQKTVIKEVRFTSNTDEHDFDFKVAHAERFLKEGANVRAYVQFKGRAILFQERGETLLVKFAQRLEDVGKLEQMPKLEGKRMMITIAPKKAPVKK